MIWRWGEWAGRLDREDLTEGPDGQEGGTILDRSIIYPVVTPNWWEKDLAEVKARLSDSI